MITCSRFRWHFWKFQENSMTLLDTFFLKSSPHLALVDELSLDFLAEFSSQTPATLSRQIWSKTAGSSSSSFGFQFQWYLFFCVANSTQNLGAIKPRWVSYISAPIPSTQNLVGGQYNIHTNSGWWPIYAKIEFYCKVFLVADTSTDFSLHKLNWGKFNTIYSAAKYRKILKCWLEMYFQQEENASFAFQSDT